MVKWILGEMDTEPYAPAHIITFVDAKKWSRSGSAQNGHYIRIYEYTILTLMFTVIEVYWGSFLTANTSSEISELRHRKLRVLSILR